MSDLIAIIDFRDLRALRVECAQCRASFSVPSPDGVRIPHACPTPGCRARWDSFAQEGFIQNVETLLNLISWWQTREGPKPFDIRFEMSAAAILQMRQM